MFAVLCRSPQSLQQMALVIILLVAEILFCVISLAFFKYATKEMGTNYACL